MRDSTDLHPWTLHFSEKGIQISEETLLCQCRVGKGAVGKEAKDLAWEEHECAA